MPDPPVERAPIFMYMASVRFKATESTEHVLQLQLVRPKGGVLRPTPHAISPRICLRSSTLRMRPRLHFRLRLPRRPLQTSRENCLETNPRAHLVEGRLF